MAWINRFYILFIGIILAITTGFGVAAFYPEPMQPEFPSIRPTPKSCIETPDTQTDIKCLEISEETEAKQQEFQQRLEIHRNKSAGYTRTAIFFGVAVGALFAITGLLIIKASSLIAHGLLLAGVLTAVLTRFLVALASMGASTTGTNQSNIAFIEFGILVVLSVGVFLVGFKTLKQ